MYHGIAQQMLEWRQHALQHLTVQFARGAFDHEFGLPCRVGAGLADDARKALHMPLERHHARAHEAVLDLGNGAALLLQQVCASPVSDSSNAWMLATSLAVSASARENCWMDE